MVFGLLSGRLLAPARELSLKGDSPCWDWTGKLSQVARQGLSRWTDATLLLSSLPAL